MARILLVDDDDQVRNAYAAFLRAEGYTVLTANDGDEALPLLEGIEWDLLITDLRMRRMHGGELCRQAKEKFPDLPILMITGSLPPEDCRADVVIGKTAERIELLEEVSKLIKK